MAGRRVISAFTAALVAAQVGGGLAEWVKKVNDEGRMVQQMKIQAPTMTEEDQFGYTMPQEYRCASCKAVVFHLNAAFKARHPKSRQMKEWEYTELFEETCRSAFDGYGLKLVNGKNALSGPGLPQEDLPEAGASIQMGGDGWKNRLSAICRMLVNDKVGEEELYEMYQSAGQIPESMCWNEAAQCSAQRAPKTKQKKAHAGKGSSRAPAHASTDTSTASVAALASKQPEQVTAMTASVAALASKQPEQVTAMTATIVPNATVNKTDPQDRIDLTTFVRSQALQEDLASDISSSLLTHSEWEKLIVSMAGKIYSRHAE